MAEAAVAQKLLGRYSVCTTTTNGEAALVAFGLVIQSPWTMQLTVQRATGSVGDLYRIAHGLTGAGITLVHPLVGSHWRQKKREMSFIASAAIAP